MCTIWPWELRVNFGYTHKQHMLWKFSKYSYNNQKLHANLYWNLLSMASKTQQKSSQPNNRNHAYLDAFLGVHTLPSRETKLGRSIYPITESLDLSRCPHGTAAHQKACVLVAVNWRCGHARNGLGSRSPWPAVTGLRSCTNLSCCSDGGVTCSSFIGLAGLAMPAAGTLDFLVGGVGGPTAPTITDSRQLGCQLTASVAYKLKKI